MSEAIAISVETKNLLIFISECNKRGIKVSEADLKAAAYAVACMRDASEEQPIKRADLKVAV
jgi:hypothetical protein